MIGISLSFKQACGAGLALLATSTFAQAQEGPDWTPGTFALVPGDESVAQEPSASSQIGPLSFDFFCHAFGGPSENLLLAITPNPELGGRWRETFTNGGFDGTVDLRAGNLRVGQVPSFTESASGRVFLRLAPGTYDLEALVSEQDLSLTFDSQNVSVDFGLRLGASGLGASLCPVVTACGRNVAAACGVHTAVQGATSDAVPLSDTLDGEGNPRWFKSEFQQPDASLPYYRTASVFDPDTGSQLHLSCLAREGQTLALTYLQRGEEPVLFEESEADLVWSAGDQAGRWTGMSPTSDGQGLGVEGIGDGLILRATLETLMTTDRDIEVEARSGDQISRATFSSRGSRDAICSVITGCSISTSFSPACNRRQ